MDDKLKTTVIRSFEFKLPRPKVLANTNNSEFMSTLVSSAGAIADIVLGQNAAQDDSMPDIGKIRDEFIRGYIRQNSPFLDWGDIDDILTNAKLEVKKKTMLQNNTPPEGGSENPDLGGEPSDIGDTSGMDDLSGGSDDF